jgi:hypothetical protein
MVADLRAFERFGDPLPAEEGLYLYAPEAVADGPVVRRVLRSTGENGRAGGPPGTLVVSNANGPALAPSRGFWIPLDRVFAGLEAMEALGEAARAIEATAATDPRGETPEFYAGCDSGRERALAALASRPG